MNNINNYKLIFFDFDGVIVDTELHHFYAINKVLKKFNIKITKKEYYNEYLSYDDKNCFKNIFLNKLNKILSKKQILKLIAKKTKILMSQFKKNIKFYKETIDFIKYIYSNFPETKMCIVSGALKKEIYYILKKLNLKKYFFLIVATEDVKISKPSVFPYIFAKKICEKKLNKKFRNEEILIIEDSIKAINSAKKAKFDVLAVSHTYPIKELKKTNADFILKNLKINKNLVLGGVNL